MKKERIVKSAVVLSLLMQFAKIVAFIKSIIQAHFFGATIEMDIFNLTNDTVWELIYTLAGAFGIAYVPIYVTQKEKSRIENYRISTRILLNLVICYTAFSIFLIFMAPLIVGVLTPFYSVEYLNVAVSFFRPIMAGSVFYAIALFLENILNAEKDYLFPTLTSFVNSTVVITAIILCKDSLGIKALVFSVPISFLAQTFILSFKSRRYVGLSLRYGIKEPIFFQVMSSSVSVFIGYATSFLSTVVDRALLTSLEEGAVTAVSYATVLYSSILSVFSVPLSTILYTEMSESVVRGELNTIRTMLHNSIRMITMITLPIIVIVLFFSNEIVNLIYGHGKYSIDAVKQTSLAFVGYIPCILFVSIKNIYIRAYYALNNTRRPMVIGVLEVFLNILLSLLLIKPFGLIGVVGATAISSAIFCFVITFDFSLFSKIWSSMHVKDIWKIAVAILGASAILYQVRNVIIVNSLVGLVVKTLLFIGIYGLSLFALGEKYLILLIRTVSKRKDNGLNHKE